ncbi:hypothetical protein BGZ96_007272 [Linnemannia gamsii]|uniref:Uncharacterized protein n=1 Tax=Linnemannia gamsii TaxID=64522 RepID=A0ABQ7KGA0_9FUNG|nr:hypothetical protein BGZ96_007272 [Linnemannia gamsii]
MNQGRIVREVCCDYQWKTVPLEEALTRITGAGRFCYSGAGPYDGNENVLKRLELEQSKAARRKTYRFWKKKPLQPFFSGPLRHLELWNIILPENYIPHATLPSTLTSLRLHYFSGAAIEFAHILTCCPLLEEFHGDKNGVLKMEGPWVPAQYNRCQPLRLRSLVLRNTKLRQSDLEDLLTLTPCLSELKLVELCSGTRTETLYGLSFVYSWSHLFHHLLSLPITLDSFQLSVQGQRMSETEVRQKTVDVCPGATEWSLYPAETTPGLLQELVSLPNIITTLELYTTAAQEWLSKSQCHHREAAGAFHLVNSYLCDSPHLLHLKIARIPLVYDDFDLHDRVRHYDLDSAVYIQSTDTQVIPLPERETFWTELPVHRRVWRCRKLRTLQIEMHGHGFYRLNKPVNSRLILGYIARVCPLLEQLEIVVPTYCGRDLDGDFYHPTLSFRLEGGLCLLSRLQHLRTLRVSWKNKKVDLECADFDLSWIAPSGRQTADRKRRKAVMALWASQLDREERAEAEAETTVTVECPGQDAALMEELRDLGLLSEVKMAMEEIDSGKVACFPTLEKVAFGLRLHRTPEHELQGLLRDTFQAS